MYKKHNILFLLFIMFLFCSNIYAGTYWVSPEGEASWEEAESGTPLAGDDATSLSIANTNAEAGDLVVLRGGVYNTTIQPANSGTGIEARIIYQAYEDEIPIITGTDQWNTFSGISIQNRKYIKIDGITIKDTNRWMNIRHLSSYIEIANCTFTDSDGKCTGGINIWGQPIGGSYPYDKPVTHIWFHHNTVYNRGSVNQNGDDGGFLMSIGGSGAEDNNSNHITVENNVFYWGGHHFLETYTKYNVIRNNVFHNEGFMDPPEGVDIIREPDKYGKYGNRCLQIYDGHGQDGMYNLVENNRLGHAGRPPDDNGANNLVITSPKNLVRYNYIFNSANVGLYFKLGSKSDSDDNRAYNNTIYNSGQNEGHEYYRRNGILLSQSYDPETGVYNDADYNVIKNNIVYNSYNADISEWGDSRHNIMENNWLTVDGDPLFLNQDVSDPMSLSLPDLSLQRESGAINGGIHLTTAENAGNGSSRLIVEDALYFQDGTWGSALSDIQPDWIAIGSPDNAVQISSIDYDTNTITLASSMTWSDEAPVFLYRQSDGTRVLYGNAPDIGAHEYITESNNGNAWYVDNTATGSNSGVSWADAWESFADIVWGEGGVSPGDTLYISGGASGSSKSYNETLRISFPFNAEKPTAEKPVTIRVGQTSDHNGMVVISSPDSYGIFIPSKQHIYINGEVNGEPHIRVTASNKDGVCVSGSSHHIFLSYLEIDHNGTVKGDDGIELNYNSEAENEKPILTIEHCRIHDNRQDQLRIVGTRGIEEFGRVVIHNNEIYGLHDDGIECGVRGLDFYNNLMHTFNGHKSLSDHPDGVVVAAGYARVYNNILRNLSKPGNIFGNNLYAGLLNKSGEPGDVSHLYFVNNLVYHDTPAGENDYSNKGFELPTKSSNNISSISHVLVANNTFVGTPGLAISIALGELDSEHVSDVKIVNNIIVNCGRSVNGFIQMSGTEGFDDWTVGSWGKNVDLIFDYNIVHTGAEGYTNGSFKGNWCNYQELQTLTGFQANVDGNPDPLLDADCKLSGDSPAINSGVDLSSLFLTAIQTDLAGIKRPHGEGWDIGAYECVNEVPVILEHPVSQSICRGDDLSFSVLSDNDHELSYQWQFKGDENGFVDLQGETAAILLITDVDKDDEGEYRVILTNEKGSVISESAELRVVDKPPVITELNSIVQNYDIYLSWEYPLNQDEIWDNVYVIRIEDESLQNQNPDDIKPDDGIVVYSGKGDIFVDKNLSEGDYQYAIFTYKAYNTNPVYSTAELTDILTIPDTHGKDFLRIELDGEGNIRLGQNTEGDLYTLWQNPVYMLGRGPSGNKTGLWVYSDIIGNAVNQLLPGSQIISARLVFNIKDSSFNDPLPIDSIDDNIYCNSFQELLEDNTHSIELYRIIDLDGLGQPHYGEKSGIRTGLDYNYRDHRPGINKAWVSNETIIEDGANTGNKTNIDSLLNEEEAVDIIEFNLVILRDELLHNLQFDIKDAVQAWVDGSENHGIYISIGDVWNNNEEIEFYGINEDEKALQPYLEIVYKDDGSITAPEPVQDLSTSPIGSSGLDSSDSIELSWKNPEGIEDIEGIMIIRKEGIVPFNHQDGKPAAIIERDTSNQIAENYIDTGLTAGKTYYYAIYTYDNEQNYSQKVWIKAIPAVPVTAAVLNDLSVSAGIARLSWTEVEGALSYNLYREDGSGELIVIPVESESGGTGYLYTDYPAGEGEYSYWISAVNQYGEGPLSEKESIVIDENNRADTPPQGSIDLDGEIINKAVKLEWDYQLDDIGKFIIERKSSDTEWEEIDSTIYCRKEYYDYNLEPDTYIYRIKGVNSAGEAENYSNERGLILPGVRDINWEPISASCVKISWTDSLNAESYQLEMQDLSGNVVDSQFVGTNYCYFVRLEPDKGYRVMIRWIKGNESSVVFSDIIRTSPDPKGGLF